MIDIERLALLTGLTGYGPTVMAPAQYDDFLRVVENFAALVRNEVLEEAAKEAESLWRIDGQFTADEFAAAIRALKTDPNEKLT